MCNWREISNTNGKYLVNINGEVLSCQTGRVPKKIASRIDRAGYETVRLTVNGVTKTHFVHRVVAAAFLEAETGKDEVNHLNGVKTDNRVENLEWVTHSENLQHAYANGLCNPRTKVVIDDLEDVRYGSVREAATAFGLKEGTCRNYLNGNTPNRTPLRYGEPIEVNIPINICGGLGLLYTRKVIRYI